MSILKTFAKAGAAVAIATVFAATAHAAATIKYAGGQFTTFDGFDWSSNATAFTTGFNPTAGASFGLTFFSYAAALQSPNIVPSGMDLIANGAGGSTGFNWTVVANITEKVDSCNSSKTHCDFDVSVPSTFDIYYQPTFSADHTSGSNGTGFTLGTKIISGTLNTTSGGSGGSFSTSGNSGSGISALTGLITYTNSAYVAPDLIGTTVVTTLQLGSFKTAGYTDPGGYNGTAWNVNDPSQIVFQADANQSFTNGVPEPGALALVALALVGAGVATRRKGGAK